MRNRILLAAALAFVPAANAANVEALPTVPSFGDEVRIDLANAGYPYYLPGTRYVQSGNSIVIDYDYTTDGWAIGSPAFGADPISFGELPPGNYTVTARLHDAATGEVSQLPPTNLPVMAPDAWGIYSVPADPDAFAPINAVVRSAVFYDTASLRATVTGNVIRVDFDYHPDAPTGGAAPPGTTSYGSVQIAGLAPGTYRLEGWGRPVNGGASQLYFTRDIAVASTSPVIEYYAESTKHYFMSALPSDIAGLDPGTVGWKRTGQRFKAWLRQQDAPPGAMPVCRFYAAGPNSHFYSANPADCEGLKALEAEQRAQAAAQGQPFLGWQFEQIAFYALVPVNGQCPGDTYPVYRAYNQRAQYNDSNHRFMADPQMRVAELALGWADEGVAFCSPY